MKGLFLLWLAVFFGFTAHAQNQTENVIPLTTYSRDSGSTTNFTINFARTAMQLDDHHHYTLLLKNADGEAHPIPTAQHCRSLSLVNRLVCFSTRSLNLRYVTQSRVKSALITVNGIELTNASNFNETTSATEISILNLSAANSVSITLTGSTTAYIQLALIASISPYDQTAPSIMTNTFSNTITNNSLLHILVTDLSETTTEVYNNELLILTTQSKEFDVTLTEGINNLAIKSRDSFNNISPDLLLPNIRLDTALPSVTNNLKTSYFLKEAPGAIALEFYPNEALANLKVNGQTVTQDSADRIYRHTLSIEDFGVKTISVAATDLAGNQLLQNFTFSVNLDNTAPVITIAPAPSVIIAATYTLSVEISDANSTSTLISVDGAALAPISEKVFSYVIEFPQDMTKTIVVTSTDAAGNISTETITVTRDAGPLIAQILFPLPNTVVSTRLFEMQISANRPIAKVIVSGVEYNFTSQQTAVKVLTQVPADGNFSLIANITDVFGFEGSTQVNFSVSSTSISAWDYQQCSGEQ